MKVGKGLTGSGRLAADKLDKRGCVVIFICKVYSKDWVRVRVRSRIRRGRYSHLKRAQPVC